MTTMESVEVFQGSDWMTHRRVLAVAMDTLDQMDELCQMSNDEDDAAWVRLKPDLFEGLAELVDDLGGELAAAEADLWPTLQHQVAQRWMVFEIHTYLDCLHRLTLVDYPAREVSDIVFDQISQLTSQIKEGLKKIDAV